VVGFEADSKVCRWDSLEIDACNLPSCGIEHFLGIKLKVPAILRAIRNKYEAECLEEGVLLVSLS